MNKRLLYPANEPAPEKIETAEFVIRPLTADDCPLDYDAVMSSKESLRIWEQSDWPTDDFTIEENLEDLVEHEADHKERIAFTFTIMNCDETECLGCIYINRLVGALRTFKFDQKIIDRIGDYEASVSFWIRQSKLADNLDYRVLSSLIGWFKSDWRFSRVLYNANSKDIRQLEMMDDLELKEVYSIRNDEKDVNFLFYE